MRENKNTTEKNNAGNQKNPVIPDALKELFDPEVTQNVLLLRKRSLENEFIAKEVVKNKESLSKLSWGIQDLFKRFPNTIDTFVEAVESHKLPWLSYVAGFVYLLETDHPSVGKLFAVSR